MISTLLILILSAGCIGLFICNLLVKETARTLSIENIAWKDCAKMNGQRSEYYKQCYYDAIGSSAPGYEQMNFEVVKVKWEPSE